MIISSFRSSFLRNYCLFPLLAIFIQTASVYCHSTTPPPAEGRKNKAPARDRDIHVPAEVKEFIYLYYPVIVKYIPNKPFQKAIRALKKNGTPIPQKIHYLVYEMVGKPNPENFTNIGALYTYMLGKLESEDTVDTIEQENRINFLQTEKVFDRPETSKAYLLELTFKSRTQSLQSAVKQYIKRHTSESWYYEELDTVLSSPEWNLSQKQREALSKHIKRVLHRRHICQRLLSQGGHRSEKLLRAKKAYRKALFRLQKNLLTINKKPSIFNSQLGEKELEWEMIDLIYHKESKKLKIIIDIEKQATIESAKLYLSVVIPPLTPAQQRRNPLTESSKPNTSLTIKNPQKNKKTKYNIVSFLFEDPATGAVHVYIKTKKKHYYVYNTAKGLQSIPAQLFLDRSKLPNRNATTLCLFKKVDITTLTSPPMISEELLIYLQAFVLGCMCTFFTLVFLQSHNKSPSADSLFSSSPPFHRTSP